MGFLAFSDSTAVSASMTQAIAAIRRRVMLTVQKAVLESHISKDSFRRGIWSQNREDSSSPVDVYAVAIHSNFAIDLTSHAELVVSSCSRLDSKSLL